MILQLTQYSLTGKETGSTINRHSTHATFWAIKTCLKRKNYTKELPLQSSPLRDFINISLQPITSVIHRAGDVIDTLDCSLTIFSMIYSNLFIQFRDSASSFLQTHLFISHQLSSTPVCVRIYFIK